MNNAPPGIIPCSTTDTIRYGDTDCQGHVNNAVFSNFYRNRPLGKTLPPTAARLP